MAQICVIAGGLLDSCIGAFSLRRNDRASARCCICGNGREEENKKLFRRETTPPPVCVDTLREPNIDHAQSIHADLQYQTPGDAIVISTGGHLKLDASHFLSQIVQVSCCSSQIWCDWFFEALRYQTYRVGSRACRVPYGCTLPFPKS